MSQPQQLSPAERQRLMRQQDQQQQAQEGRQLASGAAQQAMGEGQYAAPGYWDVIGDPDISRERFEDDEHLGEFVATEMSDKFALGNISYDDWKSWGWQIENEFFTMENEFVDGDCKLDEGDMAEMYGEQRPKLTDERARRLRSSSQVKKMMTSLSVGARGLRSGTEIHAVARSENAPEEQQDDGRLARAKQWLTG